MWRCGWDESGADRAEGNCAQLVAQIYTNLRTFPKDSSVLTTVSLAYILTSLKIAAKQYGHLRAQTSAASNQ